MNNPPMVDVLYTLMTYSEAMQETPFFLGMKEMYSDGAFNRDFQTIKISGPRRSGHSYAVAKAMAHCPGPVVVPHHAQKELYERSGIPSSTILVGSGGGSGVHSIPPYASFNYLYVDNFSTFDPDQEEVFRSCLLLHSDPDKPALLVLMG